MGVVEEGQEVMAEGEEKEDALADLALIGAAQRYRVAACEVAGGGRKRRPAVESDSAHPDVSVAKMPEAIEQSAEEA